MSWLIKKSSIHGTVNVPSSKSLTLRAIIIASISNGVSEIINYLKSDDTDAVIDSLRKSGIKIEEYGNSLIIHGNTFIKNDETFNVLSSATALRFLIPIFLVKLGSFKITGNPDLLKRPLDSYLSFFEQYQISYKYDNNIYHISGKLLPGQYEIDGNISSQYASGLFLALSMYEEASNIIISNKLSSKPYFLMTIKLLEKFGSTRTKIRGNLINISHGNIPFGTKYEVEGDYSQAANYLVLGALGFDVKIKGLQKDSLQGDYEIINFIKQFGGNYFEEDDLIGFKESNLEATTIDLIDNPDLFLILGVLAIFSKGKTKFTNIQNLRYKESNRIKSFTAVLDKLNIEYTEGEDFITINGNVSKGKYVLDGQSDHRVIMALTILALALEDTVFLINTTQITKTYPNFKDDIIKLGGNIEMKTIDQLRKDLINIDKEMIDLFKKRTEGVKLISQYKKDLNLPIVDKDYEKTQLKTHLDFLGDKSIENYYKEFYSKILDISYSLQEGTVKMGLIGKGLSHSLSPKLHHIIGRLDDFKYDFELVEVEKEEGLKFAINRILNHEFKAYVVTMPYKKSVIPFLDMLTNKAYLTGTVNLIYLKNGALIGDNVDYDGVIYSLEQMDLNLRDYPIFILGTGATSQTVAAVLKQQDLNYTFVTRNKHRDFEFRNVIDYHDLKKHSDYILMNTTPVGMYPNVDNMPVGMEEVKKAVYVFDVIYNPNPTKLVKNAKAGLGGLDMLISQGIAAYNQVFNRNMKTSKRLVEAIKKELYE